MPNYNVVEIKAFLPARDFELSKRFYADIGFTVAWDGGELAYLHHGNASFLLQNFYVREFAENLMMHLLVEDLDAWYQRLSDANIAETYGVNMSAAEQRPWGMRDFTLNDPSGVLWRIGQNTGQ